MADSTTGAALGALVTGAFAAIAAYLNHRSKTTEVDADARIRPQLAFYEDLMTRVTALEQALSDQIAERERLSTALADMTAQHRILESRVLVLTADVDARDATIADLRQRLRQLEPGDT